MIIKCAAIAITGIFALFLTHTSLFADQKPQPKKPEAVICPKGFVAVKEKGEFICIDVRGQMYPVKPIIASVDNMPELNEPVTIFWVKKK